MPPRRAGFKLNRKTIARILHTHDGGKRAAAQKIFNSLPADVQDQSHIDVYQTDREVVGIVVPAYRQARDGVATRAAGKSGLTPRRR